MIKNFNQFINESRIYEDTVRNEIVEFIKNNYNKEELLEKLEDNRDDFEQELYDTLCEFYMN